MKCFDREQLFAFVNHLAGPQEEEEGRSHVAGCATCRATLDEYRQLNGILDEWKTLEPSPWFEARVRQAAKAGEAKISRGWWREFFWTRAFAPALLVMIIVAAPLLYVRMHPRQEHARPAAPAAQPSVGVQLAPKVATQPEVTAQGGDADDMTMYENLPTLEDYDMLASFDVLSELPQGAPKVAN